MTTQAAPRLGVDIGGTFTDLALEADGRITSVKVLTTRAAPEEAVVEGLARVCREAGVSPSALGQIIHGTTLATNALIERRGARTALVTTEGFRDVIEMRTESRFEQYDLNLRLPEPLIPRQRRLTVAERMDAKGRVLVPLEALDGLLEALERGGYESVAVGFLHSYANPAHEEAVRDAILARLPGVSVSISSEVSPQMREYERISTVCADAYVKPLVGGYLRRLGDRLREAGASCPVFLMHSGGGILDLEAAAERPVRLVESGPAGGAIFAAHLAARFGIARALSFDMGGTTAKLCLIRDASPKRARVFEVARSTRFKKGSGMPVSIPVIDMVEIGAGGGSLASVDAMGRVQVGPESAGSEPGPACYGRGGARAAVTDADLALGRLDPMRFAGGTMALDPGAAEAALGRDVGGPLGLDAPTAALAVSEMVDEAMASAARVHAVENGEDPADYAMIAFGGAAPLHAARLCETLGIDRFLVPPGAGVGSALGFLRAPAAFEATRSRVLRLSGWDAEAARSVIADLTEEAAGFVARCAPGAATERTVVLHMRYVGQGWEVPVTLSEALAADPEGEPVRAAFEAAYAGLFDRVIEGLDAEVTVFAVQVATLSRPPEPVPPAASGDPVAVPARRSLLDPASGRRVEAAVLPRSALADGSSVEGPAVVEERETTLVLPPGWRARGRADGTIEVLREIRP